MLSDLQRKGVKIVACRGSITDYLPKLRGQQPRGWPPAKTWDTVPGSCYWASKEVVIATMAKVTGSRAVPPCGERARYLQSRLA